MGGMMHSLILFTGLLLGTIVSAVPIEGDEAGIGLIALAFLYDYGNGNTFPSGIIGPSCSIPPSSEPFQCEDLGAAIKKCQTNGVTVLLFSRLVVQQEHILSRHSGRLKRLANTSGTYGKRKVMLYIDLLEQLSSMAGTLISRHLAQIIFYNNSSCSVNDAFGSSVTNIAGTESPNARILSGLPASPYAATGTYDGAQYYLQLRALAALLREFASHPQLGGVMLWSAGFSGININHSCNHARDRVCTHLTSGLPSVFHESSLVHMPANLEVLQASTLNCSGLTAWNALFGVEGLKPKKGDWVLVQGTGGASIAALQFALAAGATIIATTSSTVKAQRLKSLGAHVLNYR
ncbi:hypothetical protein BO85DRAFT_439251 [Aspergillus piperis CBS 112811]|uniref:NAD(P)-binding protein n=1 Tax=Aspergillus piperis CBS 112811 TaxID=1448313 RepID=A0A8G1R158_9EURO|nr:hypothetical protein BO85DRAFT_439251 [Aspergillus piperis CBS 112811]RAH56731.1 hypothetical protein BO85DRAFT_439251 [Aspergillus piperis CBS 112811]